MQLLTTNSTPIFEWLCWLLGKIMSWLFTLTGMIFGTPNVGWAIILFTIIMSIILLPLTIKQQKSSKLMSFIQPEIKAIQDKYKGKEDQQSMVRMRNETNAVYEKYGTSMTGGCGQTLLMFPILIGLYQVIYRIPGYVADVYGKLQPVALKLTQQAAFINQEGIVAEFVKANKMGNADLSQIQNAIDFLYKLSAEQQIQFSQMFSSIDMTSTFSWLKEVNSFCGLYLADSPWNGSFVPTWAWLIPILAAISQWLSAKLMTAGTQNKNVDPDDPSQATMKTMNLMMPIMSLFFCFTFPVGIGIYWIVNAVVRTIEQIIINKGLNKMNIEDIVAKNLEKTNKKRAKKGLPPKTIDEKAIRNAKRAEDKQALEDALHEEKVEQTAKHIIDSTEYYNTHASAGTITSTANMVAMFNQRQEEMKRGKKKEDVKDNGTSESNS